ncbi:MAG: ATP-binding cassette domain-containing protein [Alphaproteobacteria bacterium]|nr:ATP-binding cassette domain-containing protein [Alphaproteobacteria bacterium]
MAEVCLTVTGLTVAYANVVAVDDVDLDVSAGEVVALIGANGAGKSSLLKGLMGLGGRVQGSIVLARSNLAGLPPPRRARLGMGYVPEGRRVFAGMTAEENLLVASTDSATARTARTEEMYALFPQLGVRRDAPAWQLSGGEQQMLAVARALMTRPRLLLVDEPTLGLAPAAAQSLIRVLRGIAAKGAAVLMAEQNARAALAAADRAVLMHLGRIEASGTAAALAGDERLLRSVMGG